MIAHLIAFVAVGFACLVPSLLIPLLVAEEWPTTTDVAHAPFGGPGYSKRTGVHRKTSSLAIELPSDPNCEPSIEEQVAAAAKLRCPPFAPTDVDLFTPEAYPSGSGPTPSAAPYEWSKESVRTKLKQILQLRFGVNETALCEALGLFDDPHLIRYAPDARIRAAIVALKGTIAEYAIDSIRSGTYFSVSFAPYPMGLIAVALTYPSNNTREIQINQRYEHEDIRLLSDTLAHEVLHNDGQNSCREERMNYLLEAYTYAQFVDEDPSVAHPKTELSRRLNTRLLAVINSRSATGNLRIDEAQGNVYPGGLPLANFEAAFTPPCAPHDMSPGSPTLVSFVFKATGLYFPAAAFDEVTEDLIQHHQNVLSAVQLVRIAESGLRLNTSCGNVSPVGFADTGHASSDAFSALQSMWILLFTVAGMFAL
jgi:hypothetical protein